MADPLLVALYAAMLLYLVDGFFDFASYVVKRFITNKPEEGSERFSSSLKHSSKGLMVLFIVGLYLEVFSEDPSIYFIRSQSLGTLLLF